MPVSDQNIVCLTEVIFRQGELYNQTIIISHSLRGISIMSRTSPTRLTFNYDDVAFVVYV